MRKKIIEIVERSEKENEEERGRKKYHETKMMIMPFFILLKAHKE